MRSAVALPIQSHYEYGYTKYSELYLECRTGGSNKFYKLTITNPSNSTWIATWGPIGKTGQSKTYSKTEWSLILKKKLDKGYVLMAATEVNTFASATPAKAPDVDLKTLFVKPLEVPKEIGSIGTHMDFDIHIEIDRRVNIKAYVFSPKLTQLSLMLKDFYKLHDVPDESLAEQFFDIRKNYWNNKKLSKIDMKTINDIYEAINS